MKANYTKGEWMAKEGQIYATGTGGTLALIPYFDEENKEEMANAQLISAAPELLEALTELLDLFYEHNPALYKERGFNRAIEAINKATGL